MYSVILMAAMTANTAEAPAFHWQKACGCQGGLFLHGGGYGSCMGAWGGGFGCCGGGYGGCWGSCYGSCYGGYGGCFGSSCYGGYGGYGAYSGGCYGCMGCYGGWYGYGEYATPGAVAYPAGNPMTAPAGTAKPETGTTTPPATPPGTTTPPAGANPPPPGTSGRTTGTSARLVIEKPADAQLYVDDRAVKSDGAVETFATPNLDPSQAYYYMVRVEAVRDGKPVSETRRVIVRAGETIRETFNAPGVTTASLKVPAGR